jgi:hypothetical protein
MRCIFRFAFSCSREHKTRAGTLCAARAGQLQKIGLVAEAKVRNDFAIALEVGPGEVVEQGGAAAEHLERAAAAMMVFGVSAEVFGEVVDVLGENCYLNLSRACVGAVRAVLLYCSGLLKCHSLLVFSGALLLLRAGFR